MTLSSLAIQFELTMKLEVRASSENGKVKEVFQLSREANVWNVQYYSGVEE